MDFMGSIEIFGYSIDTFDIMWWGIFIGGVLLSIIDHLRTAGPHLVEGRDEDHLTSEMDDINPATGLLMCGDIDMEGNPCGGNFSHSDDTL